MARELRRPVRARGVEGDKKGGVSQGTLGWWRSIDGFGYYEILNFHICMHS